MGILSVEPYKYEETFYYKSALEKDQAVFAKALEYVLDGGVENVEDVEPYAKTTVFLVPDFAQKWELPIEKRLLLALTLCYPLAVVMNTLPYGKTRHAFSLITGVFLLQLTYGHLWIHTLITSLIVFALFKSPLRKNSMRMFVNFFTMIYLSMLHLHLQYTDYLGFSMGYIGPQMFLTQKLYMTAYNLYDGYVLNNRKAKKEDVEISKKCASFALQEVPSLLEFLGYTFCFSTILVGPSVEFSIYRDACDGNHFIKKRGDRCTKKHKTPPSNVLPSIKPFLQSLAALWVFSGLRKFKVANMVTPDILMQSWSYRYLHMILALTCLRSNFYFLWKLSEGANNAWYLGFEGFTDSGNIKGWDNASNADILTCELGDKASLMAKAWNKKVSNWLKRYVYYRTNGNIFLTFAVAGVWFGFYPSFYLSLLSVVLLLKCEKLWVKRVSPLISILVSRNNYVTRVANFAYGIFILQLASYFLSPFFLRSLESSYLQWKSQNFLGHILCLSFYGVASFIPTTKTKKIRSDNIDYDSETEAEEFSFREKRSYKNIVLGCLDNLRIFIEDLGEEKTTNRGLGEKDIRKYSLSMNERDIISRV